MKLSLNPTLEAFQGLFKLFPYLGFSDETQADGSIKLKVFTLGEASTEPNRNESVSECDKPIRQVEMAISFDNEEAIVRVYYQLACMIEIPGDAFDRSDTISHAVKMKRRLEIFNATVAKSGEKIRKAHSRQELRSVAASVLQLQYDYLSTMVNSADAAR